MLGVPQAIRAAIEQFQEHAVVVHGGNRRFAIVTLRRLWFAPLFSSTVQMSQRSNPPLIMSAAGYTPQCTRLRSVPLVEEVVVAMALL